MPLPFLDRRSELKHLSNAVVAESIDGKHLLLGEVKWEERTAAGECLKRLHDLAPRIPFRRDREIHYALWSKKRPSSTGQEGTIIGPEDVIGAIR